MFSYQDPMFFNIMKQCRKHCLNIVVQHCLQTFWPNVCCHMNLSSRNDLGGCHWLLLPIFTLKYNLICQNVMFWKGIFWMAMLQWVKFGMNKCCKCVRNMCNFLMWCDVLPKSNLIQTSILLSNTLCVRN